MSKLNKKTFERLIDENIAELEKYMPENSLEKKHIIMILNESIKYHYLPEKPKNLPCEICQDPNGGEYGVCDVCDRAELN